MEGKFANKAAGSVDAFGQFAKEVAARLEAGKKVREEAEKALVPQETADTALPSAEAEKAA